MGALTFTVKGTPVPWARARQRGRAHFTDPKVKRAQHAIAAAARAAGAEVLEGPVSVVLAFDYDANETRVIVDRMFGGKATRPDVDNLIKNVLDALNGVCWKDDGQVTWICACKAKAEKKARKKKP